jgi:hypothetical protein
MSRKDNYPIGGGENANIASNADDAVNEMRLLGLMGMGLQEAGFAEVAPELEGLPVLPF